MNHPFLLVSAATLMVSAASAQCLTLGGTPISLANPDDALSSPLPMGITFPMAGAPGAPFTHCVVSTNGVVFLTTGSPPTDGLATQYGSVAQLRGAAGASPRIAPFWDDLWDAFYSGVAWSVNIDTSVSGRCSISWRDVCEWPLDTPPLFFQAELFDTGRVVFSYGAIDTSSFAFMATVGLSIGNAVADPGASDLSAAPAGTTGLIYETFARGTFDLANRSISFQPVGSGYAVTTTCQQQPAAHTPYGTGCYTQTDSFYQLWANANAAGPAMTGQSMVLTPTANGYGFQWGGGTFDAPSTPTPLGLADDGEVPYAPTIPFPTPSGPVSTLRVHANGVISVGSQPQTFPGTPSHLPTAPGFLDAGSTAFWSWHDYNPSERGSGQITAEEKVVGAARILYLTWNGVECYASPEVSNPSTLQFQLNLTTGAVTYVWLNIDADASSVFGSAHLVGYSPGGSSPDGGSLTLASTPAFSTMPAMLPLTLTVSPAPISTTGAGTLLTYTTSNLSEAAPGSGIYLGLNILSFGTVPAPGLDLAFLGAPGCAAFVTSLDLPQTMVGALPTQSVTLSLPAGVGPGTILYSQSICLVVPFSLPNGQNAFGMTTSNGVLSFISTF